MGIHRSVTLVCDGPCGTTLEGAEKVPEGWYYEIIQRVTQNSGEKPITILRSALCEKCKVQLQTLLRRNGFVSETKQEVKEN